MEQLTAVSQRWSNRETHSKALDCELRGSASHQPSSGPMLSTASTISTMDPSCQDGGDTEASTPLHPQQAPSCWLLYSRPILAIGVGALLFGSGTALSLLYFTQMASVPYLLGPLLLSVGLMFLVTGLVWVPVLKQSQSQPWEGTAGGAPAALIGN